MGQQQLLLIVLSVIIVGIAIVVGINMFTASAASSNLEAVTNDLLNLAARAQQYYVKPGSMKGADGVTNSFAGLTIADLTAKPTNDNGTYTVTADATSATITGVGTQDGDGDGTNCTVQVVVTSTGLTTTVTNR
jgi:Tfp pilus assembly protein PilE